MIWRLIAGPAKRLLAWLLAFAAVWGFAKRDARQNEALRDAKAYRKTTERMLRVDEDDLSDYDHLRDRLRERGKQR